MVATMIVTYLQTLFSMFHGLVGTGLSHYGNTSTAEKFDNIIDIGEFIFPYLLLLF